MIVWRELTIIDYHEPFDQGLTAFALYFKVFKNHLYYLRYVRADLHDFVAYDKLTTGLRHELFRVNQTYNSLNGPKSCRRPVVSLSYATKSYHVNRPSGHSTEIEPTLGFLSNFAYWLFVL